ncbi:MAG TPA: hypothetical protein VHB25_04340 [Gemmatimonadaceae bacterium]|nr:hypothetical protein [Gemmatimonadaceae bacterium]
MRIRTLLAVVAAAFTAPVVGALAAQVPQGTLIPIPYRTYIGINPLGIAFDIASIEIENAVAPGITLGGVGSYTAASDERFTTFDLKLRYYPGEVVLRGFSLGASVGYTKFSNIVNTNGTTDTRQTLDAPTIGIIADYNWMLGVRRRFILGTGVGAKRVLASSEDRDRVNIDRVIPTARFIVGIAF